MHLLIRLLLTIVLLLAVIWYAYTELNTFTVYKPSKAKLPTNSAPCNVCLSWKIRENLLILVCKVQQLDDAIIFSNSSNKEVARCYPPPVIPNESCEADYGKVNLNYTTNETTFVLDKYKNRKVDGTWTCTKGGKLGQKISSQVEVLTSNITFIPQGEHFGQNISSRIEVLTSNTKFIPKDAECRAFALAYSLGGCVFVIIITEIINLVVKCKCCTYDKNHCQFPRLSCFDDEKGCCDYSFVCCKRCKCALKIGIEFCCGLTVCVPLLTARIEGETCPVPGGYFALGGVVGLTRFVLKILLRDNPPSDSNDETKRLLNLPPDIPPSDTNDENPETSHNINTGTRNPENEPIGLLDIPLELQSGKSGIEKESKF